MSIPVKNEFCFIKDESANISNNLREQEKEGFWIDNYLKHVLKFYASNKNADSKNLFSILMYDWNEKDEKSSNKYFLVNKFLAYQENEVSGGVTMFEKFFDIINTVEGSIYFQICLKIMYYFAREAIKENYDLSTLIPYIVVRTNINNLEMKTEFFKLFIIWLEHSEDEEYEKTKSHFLKCVNVDDKSKFFLTP